MVCLLHLRKVFWYLRCTGCASACHLGHIPSSLFLFRCLQAGHLMEVRQDPELRSPGRECSSAICLLRTHKVTAQSCPLKAAGGRPLRKHVKKGTKRRESLSHAAPWSLQMGSTCRCFPDLKAQAIISPSWVGSVWQWLPPCFHMSVSRCSPVSLQASTWVCNPKTDLQSSVRHARRPEPSPRDKLPWALRLAPKQDLEDLPLHRTWRRTRKCGSLPPDDPQPARMTPQPHTYTSGLLHSLLQQRPLPLHFVQFTPNQKHPC